MVKFFRAALVVLLAFAALFYAAPPQRDPSPLAVKFNPFAVPCVNFFAIKPGF